MTQDRIAPEIDVAVNVKVTLPGGAGVEVGVPIRWRAPKQEAQFGAIVLDTPALGVTGQRTAQLWSDGTTWYICATGRLLDGTAPFVIAEVYAGNTVFGSNPPPPLGDPAHRSATVDTSYGSCPWQFIRPNSNLLPVPAPVGSGSTPYVLGLWAQFDGNASYTFQSYSFFGWCGSKTDCDSGFDSFFASEGFPVLAAEPRHEQAPLTGTLRNKVGRFAELPDRASFAWDDSRQGWVWQPAQPNCGTFTLLPFQGGLLLHSTVSEPQIIAPHGSAEHRPLRLTFEVTARPGKGPRREREGFVLDVSE